MTVARQLAGWACGLDLSTVPQAARHAASRHLLDGFGTLLAARRAGMAAPAVAVAQGLGGPPQATVLGSVARVSAPAAAFANGVLAHALDFDDTHAGGLVHATAVVLPAALAVGEECGASGAQTLAAALAGYETVCRVGMASPHGFHARGLHATQVAGVFAAAVVAAKLLGLDAAATTEALGIAGSSAGGLLEFLATGASTKQLHPGSASLNGILAARLAALGATGPGSVFEGDRGIYAALSGRPADAGLVAGRLGESWEVTRITVKPFPACQLMHAALDATTAALRAGPVRPADVTEILVDVHPDSAAVVCEPAQAKMTPRTPYDAKFSLPWTVAALVIDGAVSVDTFSESSLRRPEITALARLVRTQAGLTAATAKPAVAADAPGRVRIGLRGGRVLTGEVERSRGGPSAPMTDQELLAKFGRNAGGGPAATELAARVLGLSDEPDLSAVTSLCARAVEEYK